jgi:hypothetical protein
VAGIVEIHALVAILRVLAGVLFPEIGVKRKRLQQQPAATVLPTKQYSRRELIALRPLPAIFL